MLGRMPHCSLCLTTNSATRQEIHLKVYWRCCKCDLLALDSSHFLSPNEEKKRYETHNNDMEDVRYQNFVTPLMKEVLLKIPLGAKGIEYGAGTGPVLS